MATTSEKGKSHQRKRKSSYEAIPPDMSGLKVVLLGNSWRLKNFVGNLLLNKTVLNTEHDTQNIQIYEGQMNEQPFAVVDTPDLQHTNRAEFTGYMKTLSGPVVFLLILQPEDFTKEQKDKLQSLLKRFSEKAFNQSLVLISTPVLIPTPEKTGLFKKIMNHVQNLRDQPPIRSMIIKCKNRYICINTAEDELKQKEFTRDELFTRIRQMLKENLSCGPSQEKDSGLGLSLVLCGGVAAEKSSVVQSMFGQSSECSSSEQCVKHQAEVCGRSVSLVELPPLAAKPVEEVMEQCLSCMSLCGPQGVQAFILVLPLGLLTDEDKSELRAIQDVFSSTVRPFTMILFTVDSDHTAPVVADFVKDDRDLQELCGGGYLIFNTRGQQQVSELLDSVETLSAQSKPHSYTTETFQKAQIKKIPALYRENASLKNTLKRCDKNQSWKSHRETSWEEQC